jgi:hypothetical protein
MRSVAAHIAALAFAIAAVSIASCRRSPFASPSDGAASDGPVGAPSIGDGGRQPVDAVAVEAGGNSSAGPHDATDASDADAANEADAPAGGASTDASADAAGGDTPLDVAGEGAPPADGGASDVRPEDQPCGPLGVICAPFACDVARGVCKNTCLTNDDCVTGKTCNPVGLCGFKEDRACASSDECRSGHCAHGVCCDTACNQPCVSCALPGTVGTCTLVPSGLVDPIGTCPAGSTCNGRGGCAPPTCAVDGDCDAGAFP